MKDKSLGIEGNKERPRVEREKEREKKRSREREGEEAIVGGRAQREQRS